MGAAAAVCRNVNDSCNEERINLSVLDNTRRSRLKLSQGIQGRHWEKIPPVMRGAGLESPLPRFLGEPAPRQHGISWH